MKGCGKEFVFKKEVVKLESEKPDEEEFEEKLNSKMFRTANNTSDKICEGFERFETQPAKNNHPTVKPIKLMEYLVKLVSKENATVLDPFLGSGTTAIACIKLNRKWIGIEREEDYIKIAEARIKPFIEEEKPDGQ